MQTVRLRDELLRRPLGLAFDHRELSAEKDFFHLACRRGNMMAACVVLEPLSSRRIRMRQLAVRTELQGRGIGRALVAFSERFARQQGFDEIILHARETAVGFYERLGYESDGGRFIEVTIPHVRMRKLLTRPEPQDP
jgi:ribosomal protein S18 acetylase RimI-like enzyme